MLDEQPPVPPGFTHGCGAAGAAIAGAVASSAAAQSSAMATALKGRTQPRWRGELRIERISLLDSRLLRGNDLPACCCIVTRGLRQLHGNAARKLLAMDAVTSRLYREVRQPAPAAAMLTA